MKYSEEYDLDYDYSCKKSYVIVDGDYIEMDEVEIKDIEEDFSGRDIVTFEYAGTVQQSFIVIK